jgi:hypothetical protein
MVTIPNLSTDGVSQTVVIITFWEHDKVFGGFAYVAWENCGEYL